MGKEKGLSGRCGILLYLALCARPLSWKKEGVAGLARPYAAVHGPLSLEKVSYEREMARAPEKRAQRSARA